MGCITCCAVVAAAAAASFHGSGRGGLAPHGATNSQCGIYKETRREKKGKEEYCSPGMECNLDFEVGSIERERGRKGEK